MQQFQDWTNLSLTCQELPSLETTLPPTSLTESVTLFVKITPLHLLEKVLLFQTHPMEWELVALHQEELPTKQNDQIKKLVLINGKTRTSVLFYHRDPQLLTFPLL